MCSSCVMALTKSRSRSQQLTDPSVAAATDAPSVAQTQWTDDRVDNFIVCGYTYATGRPVHQSQRGKYIAREIQSCRLPFHPAMSPNRLGHGSIFADPIQSNLDFHNLRQIQSIDIWYEFQLVNFRLRNDLYCVEWGVKLYSLTHSTRKLCATNYCNDDF